MQDQLIFDIKQAELKAEAIKRKASEDAKQMVADARRDALNTIDKGLEEAEAEAAMKIKNGEMEAEKEVAVKHSRMETEITEIILKSRQNIPDAVNLIFERIVKI